MTIISGRVVFTTTSARFGFATVRMIVALTRNTTARRSAKLVDAFVASERIDKYDFKIH